MGCWNETCFLTNVPICWGDEIVAIPLMKTSGGMGDCRPTKHYHPTLAFIYGKYDDYGGIEDPLCAMPEYVLSELACESIEKLVNIETNIVIPSVGRFVDTLSGEKKTHCDGEITYIRKHAFENLLKSFGRDDYKYGGITYDSLVGEIPRYYKDFRSYIDNLSDEFDLHWHPVPEREYENSYMLRSYVDAHRQDSVYEAFRRSFVKELQEFVKADDYDSFETLLKEFCKMMILYLYMDDCRRLFLPNRGYSQNTETDAQKLTAKLIIEEADVLQARWEEDDLPEDAWDPVREVYMEQCEIKF